MQSISPPFPPIVEQGIENYHQNPSFVNQQKRVAKKQSEASCQEMFESVKTELNGANQILPAHKKIKDHKERISFKLTSNNFYKQNSKLNQTVLPSISFKSKEKIREQKDQKVPQIVLKEELGQFACFVNQKKTLIYQRIKNEKMNYLSRSQKAKDKAAINKPQTKYFSSLFLNSKLAKNKSQKRPIWEHLIDEYQLEQPITVDDTLQFDSSFEGGNLFAVFRDNGITYPTYELFMQNDTNTKGSTQWFCFKVSNKMRLKAKFRILNFYKPTSLYQAGMKILVSADGIDWKRVGTAITYSKNSITSRDSYNLEFTYDFESTNKGIYFCYGYPYNYSLKLVPFTESIQNKNYSKRCIKKSVLCKTTMGNEVFMISISSNILFMKTQKPIIYVIARQHPGETPSSFVVEGFINFLLSNRLQAEILREQFEFRIVPMVNVDGVISGNYRTNISGNDVNRQWIFPSRAMHPQIYYLKQQIVSNKRNVSFFLDIHSHSRKMNSFFYGFKEVNRANKFYPFVCSKLNKFISYSDSSFVDDPSKMSTGRVVVQKELNLSNSLTFEVSFFGWTDSKKTKHHFKISDLQEIGMSLALGLYYSQISIKKTQQIGQLANHKKNEKEKTILKNSLKIFDKWKSQLQKQIKNQEDILSQGSSIDPEQFSLKKEQILGVQTQNGLLVQSFSPEMSLVQNQESKSRQLGNSNFFGDSIADDVNYLKNSKGRKRYLKTHKRTSLLSKFSDYDDDMNEEQGELKKSNLFSYSGNEFFMMSTKNFMVRKLEVQLQSKSKQSDSKHMLFDRQSPRRSNIPIDFKQTNRYHDKIKQIKKVFNYCLNSDTPIDQYQSCYKSFTPHPQSSSSFNRNFSMPKERKTIDFAPNQQKTIEFSSLPARRQLSFNAKRKSFSMNKQSSPIKDRVQKF